MSEYTKADQNKEALLRVCLMTPEFPPESGWGGVALYTYQLARGLKDRGHDVEVITLSSEKSGRTVILEGITVHRVGAEEFTADFDQREASLGAANLISQTIPNSEYLFKVGFSLWCKFVQLHKVKAFDVIDAPDLLAIGLMPALTRPAALSVRLYDRYSTFVSGNFHKVAYSFDRQLVSLVRRLTLVLADAITSPSQRLAKRQSLSLAIPEKLINIIGMPVDTARFAPAHQPENESMARRTADELLILDSLPPAKQVAAFAQDLKAACQSNEGLKITVLSETSVGEQDRQADSVRNLQQSLPDLMASGRLNFKKSTSLIETLSALRSATICLIPSIGDCSISLCMAAMACQKVVVTYANSYSAEFVTDGVNGRVVSEQDLPAAIGELIADQQKQERLGAQARLTVIEKHDRNVVALETESLYRQAISRFNKRHGRTLYHKDLDASVEDARTTYLAFNNMMYNMLYVQSWKFRLAHWRRLFASSPAQLWEKILRRLGAKVVAKI